jgi:protein kinase/serine/threonine-protein kinase
MLQEAVGLDPQFGTAYALLSRQQGELGAFGDPQLLTDALESARQATRVAPNEARGHHALGSIQLRRGRLSDARQAFRRALDLAPNFAAAVQDLSITDAALGRFDESLFWARRAVTLAPNNSIAYYHLSIPLISLADVNASDRWLDGAEQRFPTATRIQYMRSESDFLAGKGQDAEARIRKALAARPDDQELQAATAELSFLLKSADAPSRIETLFKQSPEAGGYLLAESFRSLHAYLLLQRGDKQMAMTLLDEALRAAQKELDEGSELPAVSMEIAAIHALRGERDEAIRWFNAAYLAGWRQFREVDNDPFFSGIRKDPEFVRIRRKMEEDVAVMRGRVDVNKNPELPKMPTTVPPPHP